MNNTTKKQLLLAIMIIVPTGMQADPEMTSKNGMADLESNQAFLNNRREQVKLQDKLALYKAQLTEKQDELLQAQRDNNADEISRLNKEAQHLQGLITVTTAALNK